MSVFCSRNAESWGNKLDTRSLSYIYLKMAEKYSLFLMLFDLNMPPIYLSCLVSYWSVIKLTKNCLNKDCEFCHWENFSFIQLTKTYIQNIEFITFFKKSAKQGISLISLLVIQHENVLPNVLVIFYIKPRNLHVYT